MTPGNLADLIRKRATGPARFLVGLAGPPGSGKSTLAERLVHDLGPGAKVVPMDGFHYDDAVLKARGLQDRKGAPETFDTAGFLHLVRRLQTEAEVAIPVFDRSLELSRGAADLISATDQVLVIEGNYLLLDEEPWRDLAPAFDLTVFIRVPVAELDRRLLRRWAHFGRSPEASRQWIDHNDLPNIRRVNEASRPADVVIDWQDTAKAD